MHRNSKTIEVSERLLSTAEVARALQVSRNSVTGWISRGQITVIQLPSGQF
ncbi:MULTISPECIES: helix-turn-helix domain-containing protein [unclassified Pauljensenia]|uniref:helix-turn-helix domain-containing protein n=1 Tax=unclassified Pauljensenia TaxID=2908895 RepID=UPI0033066C7D